MIAGLIYDKNKSELDCVRAEIKEAIALSSEEDSRIEVCMSKQELQEYLEKTDLENFSCVDIASDGTVSTAEQIRRKYPDTAILLIVDAKQPPNTYIKPSVMASSLLIRPATPEMVRQTIREFISSSLDGKSNASGEEYLLETKAGIIRIPYSAIYYVEANMKKVFIRLRTEEYSFFGTLEKFSAELPEDFVRCHRGFLVNRQKIRQYLSNENVVILDDDTRIPVSRSYKSVMREILK